MRLQLPYKQVRKAGVYVVILMLVGFLFTLNTRTREKFFSTDYELNGVHLPMMKQLNNRKAEALTAPQRNQNRPELQHLIKEQPVPKNPTIAHGEELALRIQEKCKAYLNKQPRKPVQFPITTNKQHKLLFCPMCKLASTYWTRFFRLLVSTNKTALTPYDIPMRDAPPTKERISFKTGEGIQNYRDYYKYMYVRDPYSRIISAYVDKLFAPNPTFWQSVATSVIRKLPKRDTANSRSKLQRRNHCGSDLTFEEYVEGIVNNHQAPEERGKVDCHDESFMGACHPCEMKFDFIGKMEYFGRDSNHLLRKLGLNNTIEALAKDGKRLADEDALMDTVNSPFAWKADIKRCIPWREALMRIWRKLQIRGVIGKIALPLNDDEAERITKQDFIKLIRDTQALTPYSDRKKQRKEALIEIFSGVNPDLLAKLKVAFRNDFDFFEYDDRPVDIFDVDRGSLQYYGYLDLH